MGKIIWLASYPKSGNTWLRAFLHNFLRNPDEPFDINELTKFSILDSAAEPYLELSPGPISEWSNEKVAALRPKVHERLATIYPDNVFVKTHNAVSVSRGTPTITMECTAGAIYLIRNPLDAVISYASHAGETIEKTIEIFAKEVETVNSDKFVYEYRATWSKHVKSWTQHRHPALCVIRYEDALADPLRVFGGLVRFLGLPARRERLKKAIKFSRFKALQDQEKIGGFVERGEGGELFFRAGRAGQWRDILSQDQVKQIVSRHREQMERFGYIPRGY